MSQANVAVVRAIYEAFAAGDVPTVLGAMDPAIVWNEAESNPYADGNPYIGPQAVLEGVFMRLGGEWDGFGVEVGELLDAGDTVVMIGRYSGTYHGTGRAQHPQVVHVWRLANGKATAFQQHLDTAHVRQVMGVQD